MTSCGGGRRNLLGLPGEIRQRIWEFAFANLDVVLPRMMGVGPGPGPGSGLQGEEECQACADQDSPQSPLALPTWDEAFRPLLTCRQVYVEAKDLLFSSFTLHLERRLVDTVLQCRPLPVVASRVRRVVLYVHIRDGNRHGWSEDVDHADFAFANLEELNIRAHMRAPIDFHHLADAVYLARPLARLGGRCRDHEIGLEFDYAGRGVVFDSPRAGEITTSDCLAEHEELILTLLGDDDFADEAAETQVDEAALEETLERLLEDAEEDDSYKFIIGRRYFS